MKKIILALTLMFMAQASFAYIVEGNTADMQEYQSSGHSQAFLKMMDLSLEQSQGVEHKYVRYYKNYEPKNKYAAAYTKARTYFDPTTEDGFFGRHETDFHNAWFFDIEDKSVYPNEQRQQIESL